MAVTIINSDKSQPVSYLNVVVDVSSIFMLGLFMLLLIMTYTNNIKFFVVAISIYFIILNMYMLLYMNLVKDPVILKSMHHRLLNFICVYTIFLSIFMIIVSLTVTKWRLID